MALTTARVGQAIVGTAQAGDSSMVRRRRPRLKMHGVTFAPVTMDGTDIAREGWHTYLDWDLVPGPGKIPTVPMPDDNTPTVTIPNALYVPELRLTAASGGLASFGMRSGSWEFRPRRTGLWSRRFSDAANKVNGQLVKCVLDDDPGFYYVGTVLVRAWEIGDMTSSVTIEYSFYPYKYELSDGLQDWLWDPFSFVDGVIRKYGNIAVSGSESLVIHGREMPTVPDFFPVTSGTGLTVTVSGQTWQLWATVGSTKYDGVHHGLTGYTTQAGVVYDPETGRFTVADLLLADGDHTLTFTGSGTVSVAYRGGRL